MIYYLYFPIYQSLESSIMYLFLLFSVASLWIPKIRKFSLPAYAIALFFGWLDSRVEPQALIPIGLLGACCYLKGHIKLGTVSGILVNLAILIIGFDMIFHILPGFINWKMLSNYHVSSSSRPFNLYLNVDKITLGLFLTAGTLPLCHTRKEWGEAIITALVMAAAATVVLLVPAYIIGYVTWDPKFSPIFILWSTTNLLFVCVSEEAFFRGFIQKELEKYLQGQGKHLGILTASILFGFAHYPGGPIYILLSAVAGLFYGYAYFLTRRIESSILTHFSINLLHFLLFTYPSAL